MKKNKKLLIITSEPLNSSDTFSSSFELSQAKILNSEYDVSIISVNSHNSLAFLFKNLLKDITNLNLKKLYKNYFCEIINALTFLIFKKVLVNIYLIENIKVLEGNSYSIKSIKSIHKQFDNWVIGGLGAFKNYLIENGYPDIIHAHGRFLNAGVLALSIKKKYGLNYFYTEHSSYYSRNLVPKSISSLVYDVMKNAKINIFVSNSLLSSVEQYLNKKLTNTLIIPNVLDLSFEKKIKNKELKNKKFVFTSIASINPNKGIDILIKALKEVIIFDESIYIQICGYGPYLESYLNMVTEMKLSKHISFLGFQEKNNIIEILDESDVLIVSSRRETFGVTIIEALARGKPVISTRCGGPEEIIREFCGILVENENPAAIAKAMLFIKHHYHEYNSVAIRNYAIKTFGQNAFLTSMLNLYEL